MRFLCIFSLVSLLFVDSIDVVGGRQQQVEAGGEDRLGIESESEAIEKLTKINTSDGEIKKKESESEIFRLESESGANDFEKLTGGGEDLVESSMFQRGLRRKRSAIKKKAAIGGKDRKSKKSEGGKKRTSKRNMVKKRTTKGETQKNQRNIKEKGKKVYQFYGKQYKRKKAKIDSNEENKERKMTNKRILKIKQTKQKKSGDKVKICPKNGVPAVCIFNAQKVLNYERLQVTNYLKQAARLKGHKKINAKKAAKKDNFEHAAGHLVLAIGGDLNNPKCGDPTDNSTEALKIKAEEIEFIMSNYTQLKNCSAAVEEACTITNETFNASHEAKIDFCNATKWQFILNSRECFKLQVQSTNTSEICKCWDTQAAAVEAIKAERCLTKEKQNIITAQKNLCKKVFKRCREMEDHSVHLTYHCMWDHTMHLINQTAKTIHESVLDDAKIISGEEKLLDFSN